MPSRSRSPHAIMAIALVVSTAVLPYPTAEASDDSRLRQDEVRQLRASGKILPMEDIITRVRTSQPGQIVEVELDREGDQYVYEVKVIDERDVIHKLELDASTGEVLRHKERERHRGERDRYRGR